jgi:tRNA-2-methylthio-N6-dimethylallyladenosine synthase
VRDIGFAAAYSFKYSERPGTKAAEAKNVVPEAEKSARLAELQALILDQQTAFNRQALGRILPVLFEKAGRHPGQIAGKSPYLQAVHADIPNGEAHSDWIGRIVDVRIIELRSNSLHGELAISGLVLKTGGVAA